MRRRRLGTELRRLREAANLTGDQVIERVGWASASKLSRLENGRSRPDLRDILTLLDLYEAGPEIRDELTTITNGAGDIRRWLRTYPVMTTRQRPFAELEAGCAEIREYSPVIVPGLLQNQAYARVRIASFLPLPSGSADPEKAENEGPETEVQARMARQALLTREVEPPRYFAVLEEAALGRRSGPTDVIRKQLVHLCDLAKLPNVTIQVLPRDVKIADWYLPHTGFSLYRFPDPQDPEMLAIEGITTNLMQDDRDELSRYTVVFEWLQAAALTPDDTLTWLTDAVGQVSGGSARPASNQGQAKPPIQRSRRTGRLSEQ
ncbi:helix-turn-helix transcriptional regulator [Micromonospora sp. NPDC049559]|uniref:helix-turn-helix domain-containing protein n=1 Tax=Micromonospora sp. NPDC049559 TaxID=3155923 RepID=UPI00341DF7FD